MNDSKKPIKSLQMTAVLYATRREVVEYVKENGVLPEVINKAGFPTAFGVIMRRRGINPELTDDERLVYDAILRSGRLPGGLVNVIEEMDVLPKD